MVVLLTVWILLLSLFQSKAAVAQLAERCFRKAFAQIPFVAAIPTSIKSRQGLLRQPCQPVAESSEYRYSEI